MSKKKLTLLLLTALGTLTFLGCSGSSTSTADSSAINTSSNKPVISAMFPATTYAGSSAQTLTLVGSGFVNGATVSFNGVSRPAVFVSATHLTAELTTAEQATAGTYSVTVNNPDSTGGSSSSRDFTLTSLTFGNTTISTPDWTAETHGKLKAAAITANLSKIFDNSQVQRLDITIDANNAAVMQSNLATLRTKLLAPNNFYLMDDPIYVPAEVKYNGKQWYRVGIRFKGNSSLYGANSNKLPLKLKFNEFEDVYPAIADQRFYGFKSLSLKSNFKDESEIHENIAAQLFRDFGLKSSHTSYYKLYIDYGSGPVYYGLYTLVEEVDDTVIKTQYADATGNLYKPEDGAASFATGTFNTYEFAKKTNESALDYSDVQALYDALNSNLRLTDTALWKANLEKILDVPIFLKWLAANNVMQNWDTYGVMTHNFYLYRNPATKRLEWIPWDNNEALASNNRCLTLGAAEVTSQWPLIRYLLDNADYAAQYRLNVHDFATNYFNAARMVPIYENQSALIQEAVLSEGAGYTFTSSSKFTSAILTLKNHVSLRSTAALAY